MITITKERLLTIKEWRETYGPGSNVVLPAEEAEELARIALASLEAEPVAECIVEDGACVLTGSVSMWVTRYLMERTSFTLPLQRQ
ncbi:TPA: hypothetical protein N6H74_001849 [Escherichia coli]|nr:hypothetical protein [Escherichia coli]